tara:strand:- start:5123 stop:5365 length:243 start_codon:yes stop_codon:yes gene_type:complete
MKAILTILFVLFIGLFAQAQENSATIKVISQTESVVLINSMSTTVVNSTEIKVVRLYLDRNHKVKKALSFTTKANRSKLA